MTWLYAAGTYAAALVRSLAAAATTVMPALYRRQIAWWRMSRLRTPQSVASRPVFATLMFTASMRGRDESLGSRWERIQSRPQTYHDSSPLPLELRMRTAQRRTPGATPTTPTVLSRAPTVPATCVP